ncbi:MAG: translation initiation factor IF-2 [Planctomycetaceae bacterium]|nr:translation initiation factor IF-2 [Planctomycetaceae bacterium]
MPIRIYALAKELKVDSKDLVDTCARAGVTGKGSALASLDDTELEKVKAYIAGADKAAAAAPAVPDKGAPVRPSSTVSRGIGKAVAKKAVPVKPEKKEYTRDDYIAPVGTGKVKVIGSPPSEPKKEPVADAPTEPPKPKKRRAPIISLAKMPELKQPTTQTTTSEPVAQKPEIRLPKDAITGHKKGVRAPLEHLRKSVEKAAPPSKVPSGGKSPPSGPKFVSPQDVPGEGKGTGKGGRRGSAKTGDGLAGMASARADRQKARKTRSPGRSTGRRDDEEHRPRRRRTLTRKGTNTAAPRKGKVALELPCTVRSFSEAAGVASAQVQRSLMGLGVMATINSQIDDEYVELVAGELGVELEFKQKETLEDAMISQLEAHEDDPGALQARPPIVTFLGHVDHGKTSLLDKIIGIDVVSGEAGGITQHIRAYQVPNNGRPIAFVDTPGHEAFTEMRARGANVTDIAVLVVAADDGVMPQTEEAISHAKAADVPIVVALNKIDLPGADVNQAYQQLAARELLPSEWGGDVEVVKTSAITGEGIEELLETLLTIAELHEYTANPERLAQGVCLEAEQEPGRGVIAKLIVRAGTLRVGDVIVCGGAHGRVKALYDTLQPTVKVTEAGPSMPVNVTGLDVTPQAGDQFQTLEDVSVARQIAATRATRSHAQGLSGQTTRISFERFQELLADGQLGKTDEVSTLNLIVRADVQGSIEAIMKELEKLEHPEVQVKVLQASVGGITVGDVQLANASNAVIAGFNVIPDEAARMLADDRKIEIRRYDVIYKLTDDLRAMLEGKLKPEERIVELGRALVKAVFPIGRVVAIAGCYVAQGSIQRGCRIRVNRDNRTIGDYPLDSLRREKEDAKEVLRGLECGIKLAGFNDIKQDDILEAYKIEEVARTL